MRYAVIMAGGSGTRLWPLSRGSKPKQLLSVGDGRSLLRLAYDRLLGVVGPERIYVACADAHREAVLEHLGELPSDNVLGEPEGRDTANAIGLAAAVLAARDPEAEIAFVTADHVIEPASAFVNGLETAFDVLSYAPSTLVTFGIVPSSPHTGLGYIEQGARVDTEGHVFEVSGFTEKPTLATARAYLDSGKYLWNSGMFVWRADTILAELGGQLPESATGLRRVGAAWSTPQCAVVAEEVYPRLRRISIDYAVLEPVARGDGASPHSRLVVVPMAIDWLDIGSWPALAGTLHADDARNALDAVTALVDSEGNIVVSDDPEHLVATVGLTEMIIVHTRDVTMVCPKNAAERVKDLVAHVRDAHGERYG